MFYGIAKGTNLPTLHDSVDGGRGRGRGGRGGRGRGRGGWEEDNDDGMTTTTMTKKKSSSVKTFSSAFSWMGDQLRLLTW